MQRQIPFQKQSFLFTAGESAGEPGGEGAAQDAQAGQAEEGQVQIVKAVRLFITIAHTNWTLRIPPISPQMQQAENRIICDERQDKTGMR